MKRVYDMYDLGRRSFCTKKEYTTRQRHGRSLASKSIKSSFLKMYFMK